MAEGQINTRCEALIIAGSAGSLDVILKVLPALSPQRGFPVIIVLHRKFNAESVLSDLFSYRTVIPVKEIEDKEEIKNNRIYIAPADYHLLIENKNLFSLDDSEKVNYSRPSIDVTFESAADIYKNNLVCILLSGANADGVEGLKKVKQNNGRTAVQEPSTAESPYMPEQAIHHAVADIVLKTEEIAAFINSL